jgi:hypothetical protein
MRKVTRTEILVPFAVCMAGGVAMTLVASYYPDSNGYTYVFALTIALLLITAFFMARKKPT